MTTLSSGTSRLKSQTGEETAWPSNDHLLGGLQGHMMQQDVSADSSLVATYVVTLFAGILKV